MGRRAALVRLRVDARRPASWLALAAAAAAAWRLAAAPGAVWPAAALAAGTLVTAAALGGVPRFGAEGSSAWAALRVMWPIAGAVLAWLARGADPGAAGVLATLAAAGTGTAMAIATATRAGCSPAAATATALVLGAAASVGAAVASIVGPTAVPGWQFGAAACAATVTAAIVALARRSQVGAISPPGAVSLAVMASALAGMVVCLYLLPHLAWGYAALAAAWLLVDVAPRAALGAGPDGEAARRSLVATTPGGAVRPARAAARIVAAHAAALAWPPLVAAVLAGSTGAAMRPLAIAAAIGAGALALAAIAAAALAAGWSRETALALVLCAAPTGFAAWPPGPARPGISPSWPAGLMLSNPGDPARLPGPREEPRRPHQIPRSRPVPGPIFAPLRSSVRAAVALLFLLPVATPAPGAGFQASETIFPDTTRAWLSVPDPDAFRDRFDASSYGQLVADPAMKAFVDSVREQISKNGRQRLEKLGLTLEDLEKVPGGEVAVGAIEAEPGRLVTLLLVDTTGHEAEAKSLVDRIKARLLERKATVVTIAGAPPQLVVYALPDDTQDDRVPKNRRVAFALAPHALLVGDDAQQVGQALGVLEQGRKDSLAALSSFKGVMEPCRAALPETAPPLRWYVDPLAFAEAWQASRPARDKKKGPDYVAILGRQGFDAVKSAGGLVTFGEGGHGVRHHTMIHAPALPGREAQAADCYDGAARMLRFPNVEAPRPAAWTPKGVSGWSTLQWDLKAAFVAAEPLVDDVVGDKGVYDDVIASLKEDPDGPQIDVEKDLVDCLTGRITVVTDHVDPRGTDAERLVIALEAGDESRVAETIAKVMNADSDMRKIEINGHAAWELIDRSAELPQLDVDIPGAVVTPGPTDPVHDPDDEAHRRRARLRDKREEKLLPHSTVSVALGHLFIASHRDILEQVLTERASDAALGGTADFSATIAEIDRLIPGGKASCTFLREDAALQPAYELLRQGLMPKAKSLSGQLLNGLLGDGKPGSVREQRIDGSTLPEFEVIRRYLGTAALALESRPDGWYIAGVSLPRAAPDAGVARKTDGNVDR